MGGNGGKNRPSLSSGWLLAYFSCEWTTGKEKSTAVLMRFSPAPRARKQPRGSGGGGWTQRQAPQGKKQNKLQPSHDQAMWHILRNRSKTRIPRSDPVIVRFTLSGVFSVKTAAVFGYDGILFFSKYRAYDMDRSSDIRQTSDTRYNASKVLYPPSN